MPAECAAHSLIAVTQSQPTLARRTSGAGGFYKKWRFVGRFSPNVSAAPILCEMKGPERFFQHWSGALSGRAHK